MAGDVERLCRKRRFSDGRVKFRGRSARRQWKVTCDLEVAKMTRFRCDRMKASLSVELF